MDIFYMKTSNGFTNDSDFVHSDFIARNPGISIPYLLLISISTVMGCIGNSMVIGSVVTYKPLKTVGNMFVVNLAVADLCVTSFVNPFSIVGIVKGELWFEYHPTLCTLVGSLCVISCLCSLLTIMAISINRYVSVCKPQIYQTIYSKRNTILICVGLWLVCAFVDLPNHLGWNDHKYDRKNLGCVWDRLHHEPYFYVIFALIVTGSAIIIIFCYFQIYLTFRRSRKRIKQSSKQERKKNDNSVKLVRTLCIIFVVFVICWGPYTMLSIADRGDIVPLPVHLYAMLFAHLNSSANSIIYGLTNNQFRIAYLKLLRLDNRFGRKVEAISKQLSTSTPTQ